MSDERPTVAELGRRYTAQEKKLERIEGKLDTFIDQYRIAGVERRVERLEDNLRWITRALIGALIVAVVSGVVALAFSAAKP